MRKRIYPRPLKKLAKDAGVSVWVLYKDEKRGEPTLKTAKKVGIALGVDWKTFFNDK